VILSGVVVALAGCRVSEGARFGIDCSGNRPAQASRIVDTMLTLEQHMVDLTDLRDIAKAGAAAGLAVQLFCRAPCTHQTP
jgi:hypothetical protein